MLSVPYTMKNITFCFLFTGSFSFAQPPVSDTNFWNQQWRTVDTLFAHQPKMAAATLDSLKPLLPATVDLQSKWIERRLNVVFATQPYIAAEPYLEAYLNISRQKSDSDNVAFCMARLGHIYNLRKQYKSALTYELHALKLAQKSTTMEPARRAGIYASLTNLYLELEDFEKANQFGDSCLRIRLAENKAVPGLVQAYHFLGESSMGLGKTEESKMFFEKGLQLKANGYTSLLYRGMGDLLAKEENWPAALIHYEKALATFSQFNKTELRPIPRLELLKRLSATHLKMSNLAKTSLYLNEAIQLAREKQVGAGASYELNHLMAKLYEQQNQPIEAINWYKLYISQADTVMQEKLNKRLLTINTQFATEEKEKEITYLNLLSTKRRQQIYWLIAGSLLLILLSVGIGLLLFQRRQNMKRLEIKHQQSEKLLAEKTQLLQQLEDTQAHLEGLRLKRENELLQQEKQDWLLRQTSLEKANVLARFESLKNQLNPHFLFNSFNIIASLIALNPKEAIRYTQNFASLFRHLLSLHHQALISLREELDFVSEWLALQQVRFGNNLLYEINIPEHLLQHSLPPLAIHTLIENAVKHNEISTAQPLKITITATETEVTVSNPIRLRRGGHNDSTGLGLKNLEERYAILGSHPKVADTDPHFFTVSIPIFSEKIATTL